MNTLTTKHNFVKVSAFVILSRLPDNSWMTAREIADTIGAPPNSLSHLCQRWTEWKYLVCQIVGNVRAGSRWYYRYRLTPHGADYLGHMTGRPGYAALVERIDERNARRFTVKWRDKWLLLSLKNGRRLFFDLVDVQPDGCAELVPATGDVLEARDQLFRTFEAMTGHGISDDFRERTRIFLSTL